MRGACDQASSCVRTRSQAHLLSFMVLTASKLVVQKGPPLIVWGFGEAARHTHTYILLIFLDSKCIVLSHCLRLFHINSLNAGITLCISCDGRNQL